MSGVRSLIRNEHALMLLAGAVSFIIYLQTICPDVSFTDSGELAGVGALLGIAHPTGYPLFTLLARSFIILVPIGRVISRLNVLVAAYAAVAVSLFFRLSLRLLRSPLFGRDVHGSGQLLSSLCGSVILAFSSTWWSQANAVEVYALHILLIMIVMIAFVRGLEEIDEKSGKSSHALFLFSYCLALAFANHMTTVLLAPAFLFLFFSRFGFRQFPLRLILTLTPFFLAGLSLYIFLPVRSSASPLLDWGHPASAERLLWHVSGKQYQVWMFSGWEAAAKQLQYYIRNITSEFNPCALVLSIIGLGSVARRSRTLLAFLLLLAVGDIAYAVNYDIHDIDSYFLLSYIVIAVFAAEGIHLLYLFVGQKHRMLRGAVALAAASACLLQWNNIREVDESSNTMPRDFAQSVLRSLPDRSVVFSGLWDYLNSPALYYQLVERERPDVTIVDLSLLKDRSWYFQQLDRQDPNLMNRCRPEANQFLLELVKFERGLPLNRNLIQYRWSELLTALVRQSLDERPVYVDARVQGEFSPQLKRVPSGLLIRLVPDFDTLRVEAPRVFINNWNGKGAAAEDLRKYAISMLLQDAFLLEQLGRGKEAIQYRGTAQELATRQGALNSMQ